MLNWEQDKKTPWGSLTAVFFVSALLVFLLKNAFDDKAKIMLSLLSVLGVLALGSALFWFSHAFTGRPEKKRPEQVKFSYFFVIASFSIFLLPPLVSNQAIGNEAMGIVSGCVRTSDSEALRCLTDENTTTLPGAQNNQWLFNIGGALEPQGDCRGTGSECKIGSGLNRAFITGGLVVPLPLLVVALFGAAISLSRRVPEIQKQSERDYVGTAALPALTATQARERLAFQIMQFISAPLIAITAHQVIRPASEAASIALAFLAGFGSETILLLIRGVAEGIKPRAADTAQAEQAGAVEGIISVDGKPVSTEVTVRGTSLKEKSDSEGKYAIKGVPAGEQVLSAIHGTVPEIRNVKVKAGGTTLYNFDIRTDVKPPPKGLLPDASSAPAGLAIAGPDTVDIRIAIDNPDLDPGTLRLFIDDKEVEIRDGMVELSMEADVLHSLRASAMRHGIAVRAQENTTVNLDDEGSSRSLQLA